MGAIQDLAGEFNVEERTLRRAAAQGTLRGARSGPRRFRLAVGEREYLGDHWPLLAELRSALRTERQIRLAVLYGSMARGDEDADSDLDLLIDIADASSWSSSQLASRLERLVGRRVDIARLDRVEADAPLLLDRVLDEGRVLVDRGGHWQRLNERRRAIRARADRAYRRQMTGVARAIAELTR